jgi:hypothetical protein
LSGTTSFTTFALEVQGEGGPKIPSPGLFTFEGRTYVVESDPRGWGDVKVLDVSELIAQALPKG